MPYAIEGVSRYQSANARLEPLDRLETLTGLPLLRRFVLWGLMAIFVVAFVLFAAPYVIPRDIVKSLVERTASTIVGRPVSVAGNIEFSVLPVPRLILTRVAVGDGKQSNDTSLFFVRRLEVEIAPYPLLFNELNVRRFDVTEPEVKLSIDVNGQTNWRQARTPSADLDWGGWDDMRIAGFSVRGGRIVYADKRSGQLIEVVDLGLSMDPKISTPDNGGINVHGATKINGIPAELYLETGRVGAFAKGERMPVSFELIAAPMILRYRGGVANRQYLVSDGRVEISGDDARRIERWLEPGLGGLAVGEVSMIANIGVDDRQTTVEFTEARIGRTKGTGRFDVDQGSEQPSVTGNLDFRVLDLSVLVSRAGSAKNWRLGALSHLGQDGKLHISWDTVRMAGLEMGSGTADVSGGGKSTPYELNLTSLALFGGQGQGRVRATVAEGMTSLTADIELSRVRAGEYLSADTDSPLVSGMSHLSLSLQSVGGNWQEILSALRGGGALNITDGEITGHDITDKLRGNGGRALAFSQLIGSFTIDHGILSSHDVLLKGADVSLVGEGEIDLAKRVLDIKLQALAPPESENGEKRRKVRPLIVAGPLDAVTVQAP